MDFLIYLVCLVIGVIFVLFTAIAGHFFGGHDAHVIGSGGHAEAGADMSDAPGISVFSPTVIASFVTSFGGLGIILSQFNATKSPWISAPLATVGAAMIAGSFLLVLRSVMTKTQSSSEPHIADLVGVTATIITPIPENGVGEIAYVYAGSRYTAPAREERGAAIGSGASVKITRVAGSQFHVVKV
ncbi:MAG: NfeD family protein [Verrucomicrobia bacterium]|nr:NfeD family protein [Verrucomicrobiota bacterium]